MTYCNEFVHVYQGNHTVCMCGQSSYSLEQAKILDLEKQLAECQKERDEAKSYAVSLFGYLAPQCVPLDTVSGLLSQIDNAIVGIRERCDKYAAALKTLREIHNPDKTHEYNVTWAVIEKALEGGG